MRQAIKNYRVFLTLLVVFGHSMIIYSTNWTIYKTENTSQFFNILKTYINTIQMSGFVFISGYLFYNTLNKSKYNKLQDIFIDKGNRLLIPYVITTIILVIPIRFLINYNNYRDIGILDITRDFLLVEDSGNLWFLIMLFNLFIIFFVIREYLDKNYLWFVSFIFYFCSIKMPNIFQIKETMNYFIFFYLGYVMNKNKYRINLYSKRYLILVVINLITWSINIHINNYILNKSLVLICSLTGVVIFWGLFNFLKYENKFIDLIEKYSLRIYLIHSPIMYIFYNYLYDKNINPFIFVILVFSMILTISIFISMIIDFLSKNLIKIDVKLKGE